MTSSPLIRDYSEQDGQVQLFLSQLTDTLTNNSQETSDPLSDFRKGKTDRAGCATAAAAVLGSPVRVWELLSQSARLTYSPKKKPYSKRRQGDVRNAVLAAARTETHSNYYIHLRLCAQPAREDTRHRELTGHRTT